MTTQREIQELFNKIAFPETPEERDATEQAVVNLLAQAWEEGFDKGFYDPMAGHHRDACESLAVNPYTAEAQVDGL